MMISQTDSGPVEPTSFEEIKETRYEGDWTKALEADIGGSSDVQETERSFNQRLSTQSREILTIQFNASKAELSQKDSLRSRDWTIISPMLL
jgi:hypothetical protein